MIKNYLLISFRNLRKHFSYSAINILGLGLGLATCLLLVTWIRHELSYDRFHEHADRIYRASLEYSFGGQTAKTSVSPTALLPVLQKNFREIENGVRVYNPSSWNPFIVKRDDKIFQEGKFYYADSTFFQIFSYTLLRGTPDQVLSMPNSVVLTPSTARKYFGEEDPMGKTLFINNKTEYTVTGLLEDLPSNSLLQFDFMASFSSLSASKEQIWWSANYETYLLLTPETNLSTLINKTNDLVKKELASELTNPGDYVKYNFIPFTDIYLRSDMNESVPVSDIQYIYIFGAIALLVLIIACINYINLATAKAADRAKEVGIRKVIGAVRNQLLIQFMSESVLITLLALVLAFLVAPLSLPFFNTITGKHFATSNLFDPIFLTLSFLVAIGIAIAAGAYPAIAITSFKPVSILKGNFKTSGKGIWLRKSLVVFQFCISIILITGTLIIIQQVDFIQAKKLGFNKENILILPLDAKTEEVYNQLKKEILRSGSATHVARATESPTKINGGYSINLEGGPENGMIVTAMSVDEEFIPALGMDLSIGRNFTENDFQRAKSDSITSFILNESALKELSLSQEKAIGTRVRLNGRHGEIIGIVKDFHFASLHEKITPLVLFNEVWQYNYVFIKLSPGDVSAALGNLKNICADVIPHRPFEFRFLDQQFDSLYSNEQRISVISTVFATLTIIIACLGLLGLVAYSASQKIKEIGIRKVLGASALSIVVLITRDYTRLVLFAILVGLPLAYYIMENFWLSDFVYRTTIGPWPFVVTSIGCIVIALGTASYQAIKAALINPVETLRNE